MMGDGLVAEESGDQGSKRGTSKRFANLRIFAGHSPILRHCDVRHNPFVSLLATLYLILRPMRFCVSYSGLNFLLGDDMILVFSVDEANRSLPVRLDESPAW